MDYCRLMKVCTPSYVKVNMAKVLDAAFEGRPTVIFRKGRLAGWKGDWGHNWMWQ